MGLAVRADTEHMGMTTRGGMWCDFCMRPVAGQRPTHRARNLTAFLTAPMTGGASLASLRTDAWHCPTCGQGVRMARRNDLHLTARNDRRAPTLEPPPRAKWLESAAPRPATPSSPRRGDTPS